MTTLHRLELLVAVAKRLNITQASRELHVSQPSISQEIRQLEKNLGVKLISKKRRGIELTDAGAVLRTDVENFLARLVALKKKYGARVYVLIFALAAGNGLEDCCW